MEGWAAPAFWPEIILSGDMTQEMGGGMNGFKGRGRRFGRAP